MTVKEREKAYKEAQAERKAKIKAEPNKHKRFWKWIWFIIIFPFEWIWVNLRDWQTMLIFIIVFLVVSSEVWLSYLLGLIFYNQETLRNSLFAFASVCWVFWLSPATPFIIICISLTIAIKSILNKVKERKPPSKRKDK